MSGNQNGSYLKKTLLAAAVAAFLSVPCVGDARVLAGSVTERKQNKKIESMLKSARKNADSGKVQKAIESYWKILELDPNETFAYLELGEVYVNLRIFDRALELLEPGLTMAEREMDCDTVCYYYCILTQAHLGLNQIGQANKALIKAAEASPKNPMPRKVMGDIYLANDRIADAMKAYRKAVELDPGYQPAVEKLGELVAKYGDKPPAKQLDKQVIKAKAEKLPATTAPGQTQQKAPARPTPEKTAAATPVPTGSKPTARPVPVKAGEAIPADEPVLAMPVAKPSTDKVPDEKPVFTDAKVEPAAVPDQVPAAAVSEPASAAAAAKPTVTARPTPMQSSGYPVQDTDSTPVTAQISQPAEPAEVQASAATDAADLATSKTAVIEGSSATATAQVAGSQTADAGMTASPAEIEAQIDKLLAGTPEEKSVAVSFFVKLGEKGLTEIEELLYDPDPEVRVLAVQTLPQFTAFAPRVKTMLQDASDDPDPIVIEEINKALQGLQ